MKFFAVILAVLVVQARSHEGGEFERKYNEALDKIFADESLIKELEAGLQKDGSESIPRIDFTCSSDDEQHEAPKHVHELRPEDIGVVGVLGDSVNAGIGVGARSVFEVILPNRGEAFLGGGGHMSKGDELEDNVITLPNILKKFNPNLKGWSYGIGADDFRNARNNKAVSGAKAKDLVGQARNLVTEMKKDMDSYLNDWKVISIFIGGNDLCQSCDDSVTGKRGAITGEEYARHIQNAIDVLHEEVPKVYLNMVTMFDIGPMASMRTGFVCDILQTAMCTCPSTKAGELRERQMDYSVKVKEMVNSGRFDTRDDFTVVLQSHMRDSTPPKIPGTSNYDMSWLSFDCFHPARKFHQAMALLLWNAMLTNNHDMPSGVELDDIKNGYFCPTETNPYLFTNFNSHQHLSQKEALAANGFSKKTEFGKPEAVPFKDTNFAKVEEEMKEIQNRVEKVKEYLRHRSADPFPVDV